MGLLPTCFAAMRATALPIDQRTTRCDAVTLLRLGRILNFIKKLKADDMIIPNPGEVGSRLDPALNRHQAGLRLLAAFFHDGVIRGVTPDGSVYDHQVSMRLSRRFLKGLGKTQNWCRPVNTLVMGLRGWLYSKPVLNGFGAFQISDANNGAGLCFRIHHLANADRAFSGFGIEVIID